MSDFSKLKSRKPLKSKKRPFEHSPLCKYKTTDFFGFYSPYNNELIHVPAGDAVRFIEYCTDETQVHISYKGMHMIVPKELVSLEKVANDSDNIEFKELNWYEFNEYAEATSADGDKVLIEPGEKAIFIKNVKYEVNMNTCLVMYMLEEIAIPTFILSEVKEV